MSVIVFGNGARELAIIRSLLKSSLKPTVYCWGECQNPGITDLIGDGNMFIGKYKNTSDIQRVILEYGIVLAIIGPEKPLASGLADFLREYIYVVGPGKNLARIESSKFWARKFIRGIGLEMYNPDFKSIRSLDEDISIDKCNKFLERTKGKVAIKLDGLEGGKGVRVWGRDFKTLEDSLEICYDYIKKKRKFVLEECLEGVEFSLISLSDGVSNVHFPPVVDYKPVLDGNKGANTGSMGAILDRNGLQFLDKDIVIEAEEVNRKVLEELKFMLNEKYIGFLYGSFMYTRNGLKIIEFNCRLGDPEGVLLMESMNISFYEVCKWMVNKRLGFNSNRLKFNDKSYLCKYVVPLGYPEERVVGENIDMSLLDMSKYEVLPASVSKIEDGYKTLGSRSLLVLGETEGDLSVLEAEMNVWLDDIIGDIHYRKDLVELYHNMGTITSDSKYKSSGVDIDLVSEAIRRCTPMIERTHTLEVVKNRGGFGGMFSLNPILEFDFTEPILVTSTDGVGTKTEFVYKYLGAQGFEGLGRDLVNHCINDILVQGATPLYFVDYFASSKFSPSVFTYFMSGITDACKESQTSLLGGETAEMPGIYVSGSHDVVGTITGIVDGDCIIDGRKSIDVGDAVIGIPSNGLHTNGFSLIRKIYENVDLDMGYVKSLVGYHRSYLKEFQILRERNVPIHGLCHITGGGLIDNPPRVLPKDMEIEYDDSWEIPEMYRRIQHDAGLSEEELRKVFNCGIGMMIIVPSIYSDCLLKLLDDSFTVGKIVMKEDIV